MKKLAFWTGCAALALGGCGDDEEAKGGSVFPALDRQPAFAVQLAEFGGSSGIALLDEEGALLEGDYINSGTEAPGLSAALVGDIALPTSPCDPTLLTVLGRSGGEYVLQVNVEEGFVERQVKTQGEGGGTAFSSNPHDILCLDDDRAIVSRHGVNAGVDADDIDRGDDLAVLDLAKGKVTSRVDLGEFHGTVSVIGEDEKEAEEKTFASPDLILRVGEGHALVGLARLSQAFNAHPEGMALVLDLEDLSVAPVALEGLANCGSVYAIPGRENAGVVQCVGVPYGDPASAGLAIVSVSNGKGKVEHVYQAPEGEAPIYSGPTPIGGTRVIAGAANFTDPDEVYVLDLATGEAQKLFTTAQAGDLGSGAVRLEAGLVLIPDASEGVRVFKVDGDEVEERDSIELDPVLPARAVRALRTFD
jgi:hypothetical protein